MVLELKTDRLLIRKLYPADLEDFLAYRSDPDIVKYQDFEPYSREDAIRFIDSQKDKELSINGDWVQFGLILKNSGMLIGDCGVKIGKNRTAEIGCTISKQYQRQGYTTEALNAVMKFLFDSALVEQIVAITDVNNCASIRMIENLGFNTNSKEEMEVIFKGAPGKEYHYSISKDEWESRVKSD